MPQLPWNNLQEISLLQLVLQHGGHVASRSNLTKVWTDILEAFKIQDCMTNFTEEHLTGKADGLIRKLRDKLKALLDKAQKEMGWGDFW